MEYRIEVDFDFLAHHGTKGMKWGVWNDETKRKYGMLQAAAGGGGGSKDDEEEEEESRTPGLTSGNMRKDRDSLMSTLTERLGQGAEDVINQHLDDIQSGNIEDAEARILSIVNAAAKAATGEGAILNPKGGTDYDWDSSYQYISDGKIVKNR